MDFEADPPKTLTTRSKCSACFKQYKKKEHLVAHMKASHHSVHQPKCGWCAKHCKTYESLREHLTGPLSKAHCSRVFADLGCRLCMKIFDSSASLSEHKEMCQLTAPAPLGTVKISCTEYQVDMPAPNYGNYRNYGRGPEAIAIDCEMVGGGSDGTLDLCGRVCLIDEDENLIFHTYVQPQIPVTNYRYEVTGITEEHLRDAMPIKEARERILQILYNGESIGRLRLDGGKARLLVGHGLEHDLGCLRMNYPDHLLRDTAKYRPFMKTNLVSHSLKYLTQTYLGYDIQSGVHDPFVDCVSAMRLYKRMRAQDHHFEEFEASISAQHTQYFNSNSFDSWKPKELESMNPDELFQISKSKYKCWCLDLRQELQV
ncbi:RNA exonuclease [Actinidia chinensis var. chinensis]|uniref:RNA exonuclease 4 n=1 Tax=Actinidia chinensis var. chinensis TaxID=1590841 RepID=A0A2R6PP41_ACTCC|nr:RNA exonuclease [Actinidia chinensis var. chinensis]